jgi:hypothetical protein
MLKVANKPITASAFMVSVIKMNVVAPVYELIIS